MNMLVREQISIANKNAAIKETTHTPEFHGSPRRGTMPAATGDLEQLSFRPVVSDVGLRENYFKWKEGAAPDPGAVEPQLRLRGLALVPAEHGHVRAEEHARIR